MRLLALDTSTLTASVAILDAEGGVLAERASELTTHSVRLLPLVDELLAACGLGLDDLEAIACGHGPGSFTGLRIGLATAKGLCFGTPRALVGVSSLAALAADGPLDEGALVVPCLDARRDEVFVGFHAGGPAVAEELAVRPAELGARVREVAAGRRVILLGEGAHHHLEEARAAGTVLDAPRTPRARWIGALALERLRRGERDSLADAAPRYVRAPDIRPQPPSDWQRPGDDPPR